jgi:hypothetical protein
MLLKNSPYADMKSGNKNCMKNVENKMLVMMQIVKVMVRMKNEDENENNEDEVPDSQ